MSLSDIANLESEYLEEKPWGWAYNIFHSNFVSVFYNIVKQGGKSSFHYHQYKYNRFFVFHGKLIVTMELETGPRQFSLGPEERLRKLDIIPGVKHEFYAPTQTIFVEVESVRCLKTDIIRLTRNKNELHNHTG